MPNKYSEEKFNKHKKLLIVVNILIFIFVLISYPQNFGFWGFRGANIYAASIIFPTVLRILNWDYWYSNRLELEQKIFYWWIITMSSAVLALILQPIMVYWHSVITH